MSDEEKKPTEQPGQDSEQGPAQTSHDESATDAGPADDEAAEATFDEVEEKPVSGTVEEDAVPAQPTESGVKKSKVGMVALIVAIIALLIAAAVAALGHYRAQQLERQQAALSPAIERNAGRIASNEKQVQTLSQTVQQQGAATERQIRALEETIGALREQIGRDQSGWILAEAEYLLLVANHRLRLERDADTALAALTIADERLRETGDPALIGVREQIAAEASALKTLSRPDLTGLALALMGLANQVDKLPLQSTYLSVAPTKSSREAGAQQVEDWRELAGAVWGDLKGLVTVRHREEALRPMLAPEQQYLLRQNLRLQLEAARLALLRTDQQQLNHALQIAREWIPQFFDDRSAATQGMMSELDRIAGIEIRPDLPDISGSLKALREHMRDAAKKE